MKLYVVGKLIYPVEEKMMVWELQGIFKDKEKAYKYASKYPNFFVFEVEEGKPLPYNQTEIPIEYPFYEMNEYYKEQEEKRIKDDKEIKVPQVPDMNICEKLREVGYPQRNGGWYWVKWEKDEDWELIYMGRVEYCPHVTQSADPDEYKGDCDFNGECTRWMNDFWSCPLLHLIKAPTVGELGKYLPSSESETHEFKCFKDPIMGWGCGFRDKTEIREHLVWDKKNEANVRAKMLIWLVENNYMNFEEV